ncbi:hypothetical protein LX16_3001 [Stackebrandtia albiflava]|uniref:Uncharacterized protein n=1 Tax=Stackebrandtia albiflava TaxID=406432 RepID=A0A562V2X6_9ACTN|nr:hypothetical protein [Stackebrandtia albiflava]TWJ12246.1 hypothetical protein LX16_3001 [Stackebrandtia albiflava]
MATDVTDSPEPNEALAPLVGRAPWRVRLGHGSFVTFDFGARVTSEGHVRGEWHLWTCVSAWRLDSTVGIVAGSEDGREDMAQALATLEGTVLESAEVVNNGMDLNLYFPGAVFRVFPVTGREYEHWMLYEPSGWVLVAGPGSSWHRERADGGG